MKEKKKSYNPAAGVKVGDLVHVDNDGLSFLHSKVGRVVHIDDGPFGYLVEMVESHPTLHDGNSSRVRCRDEHGWWVSKQDLKPITVEATIFSDGTQTLCQLSDRNKITGVADCADNDVQDPLIGAIIALALAYGAHPTAAAYKVLEAFSAVPETEHEKPVEKRPKKLRIVMGVNSYGIVGTPTPLKDKNGKQLYVGDLVRLKSANSSYCCDYLRLVVQDSDYPFVMGIKGSCSRGEINGWKVERVYSYDHLSTDYVDQDPDWQGEGGFKVVEAESMKKLTLNWNWSDQKSLGNVGDGTPLIDLTGEKLFIGDQVEVYRDRKLLIGIEPVVIFKECGPSSNGGYYVMGLAAEDFSDRNSRHDGFSIKKVKSFTELKAGDVLSDGAVIVKEEEVYE